MTYNKDNFIITVTTGGQDSPVWHLLILCEDKEILAQCYSKIEHTKDEIMSIGLSYVEGLI